MSIRVPFLFPVVVGLEGVSGRTTCRGDSDDDSSRYRRPRRPHRAEEPVWYWTLVSFQILIVADCWICYLRLD